MSAPPVTYVRAEDLIGDPVEAVPRAKGGLGRRRRLAGGALAVLGLPLLTVLLAQARGTLSLESDMMLYLLAVVIIAAVGGLVVAIPSAIFAAGLTNWFFVRPLHTFEISQGEQLLALAVFLVVAIAVSGAIEVASRRGRAVALAATQAETLSSLAGPGLRDDESLHGVLERAREVFGMESVALIARDVPSDTWSDVDRAGTHATGQDAPLRFDLPVGNDLRLVGRGRALFAEDRRLLQAFAAAAQTAHEGRELTKRARQARDLASADRQRTALLAAVGHDLRTPLAGVKAGVSSLRQKDVQWTPEQRDELLETIETSADRLDAIVANLLDASRLEAGALAVRTRAVAVDEVVSAAVIGLPGAKDRVLLDVPDDMPLVEADPGLLERVMANLLDNALRHGGQDSPVEVSATAGERAAKVLVIDHGPGVADELRERMFEPFRARDDRQAGGGVGLGLAVSRGLTEAMGGKLIADQSPEGGLTMRLRLPLADARSR